MNDQGNVLGDLRFSYQRVVGSSPSSPSFRLLLPKILRELELAVAEAGANAWEGVERARAVEVADALASACRLEGSREAATLARSLGSLLQLSREQIAPIEARPFVALALRAAYSRAGWNS